MSKMLLDRLREYNKSMLPFHMPGHKRNTGLSGPGGYLERLSADCDVTEVEGLDNLANPEEFLLELKERAAVLWKSEEAYPLVNGSTGGILAAIWAAVPKRGHVLVARNCHKSVYNGLRLCEAEADYILPPQDRETGTCGAITVEQVREALEAADGTYDLLILTSPTYEGVISDVEGICRLAHEKNIPVLVDSAHGAHLGFSGFERSAVECGADLVVMSLHKTLPSLTQTAMLHRVGTRVSPERLQAAVNLFQTSSPSYLLLASIDGCIGLLETQGEELMSAWNMALEEFYEQAGSLCHLRLAKGEGIVRDRSKLVICTAHTELTGPKLMERLRREFQIELEMAAEQYAVAMTGPGDTKETLQKLSDALHKIDSELVATDARPMAADAHSVRYPKLPPRAGEAGTVGQNRVADAYYWAYPPGIPILVPGEVITEELEAYLAEKEQMGIRVYQC